MFSGVLLAEVAWEKIGNEDELDETFQLLDDFREGDEVEARARLTELDERFRQAAGRYRDDSQAAGNLDAVLAVNQAFEVLEGGGVPKGSADPTVARLEKIYAENRPAAEEDYLRRLAAVRAKHVEDLKELQAAMTKQGKIELAVKVRVRLETFVASSREEVKKAEPEPGKAVVPGSREDNRIGLTPDAQVVILKATYGSDDRQADVTEVVKQMVEKDRVTFAANPTYLKADPFPYRRKGLTIEYTRNGKRHEQRRGEDETILISSFYCPHDAVDIRKALVGTLWKSDVTVEFKSDNTFTVDGRRGSYRWSYNDSSRKLRLSWSSTRKTEGSFDWSYTQLTEEGDGGRVFVNLALEE